MVCGPEQQTGQLGTTACARPVPEPRRQRTTKLLSLTKGLCSFQRPRLKSDQGLERVEALNSGRNGP
jgi:hypothetical protein